VNQDLANSNSLQFKSCTAVADVANHVARGRVCGGVVNGCVQYSTSTSLSQPHTWQHALSAFSIASPLLMMLTCNHRQCNNRVGLLQFDTRPTCATAGHMATLLCKELQ
jgi:hypothetical protein